MSTSTDPVNRVAVISTGSVSIRPEHVGPTWKNTYFWLFTSRRWTTPRPINVYVIEHRDGLVLFDTGQDRRSVTDPGYFPGGLTGLVYSRLAKFDIGPDETRPLPEMRGLLRSHIDLPGLRWNRITPQGLGDDTLTPFTKGHDMFGDGSIVLLPTPGHTPGSLSMLVRRPGHAPLLMVGDLTYDDRLLIAGKLPGAGDRTRMRAAVDMVNALRDRLPDLVILPAHDPGAASRLAAATRGKQVRS